MDKNRIVESAKQIKGSIKEAVGDAKLQIDRKTEKSEGKAQTWSERPRIL